MRFNAFGCLTTRFRLLTILVVGASLCSLCSTTAWANARRTPVVRAVEAVQASVVNIHGRKVVRSEDAPAGPDNFRQVNGMGTGIIIDERGYILTNHHVVDGVNRIQITTYDQRALVARLIAFDFRTDLAVIKVDGEPPFPVIRLGTSHDLMPGESVIAVGNAFGYEHTVTTGIISALHRTVQVSDEQTYRDVIQTNAGINPGNSGGPLLNIDGELIGVNVAVRVGAQGIAFSIPVDNAMDVAAQLMSVERLEKSTHGVIGKTRPLQSDLRSEVKHEFVVSAVRSGTPGEVAGLQPGDVITRVGDFQISRSLDFERALLGRKNLEDLPLTVRRGQELVRLTMKWEGATRKATTSLVATDRSWDVLGLRLEPIAADKVQAINPRYNGGLKVLEVKAEGPAAKQGIRRGDVLVGMHKWETVSLDNVAFILSSPEFSRTQPIKFYILRGSETLFGHLRSPVGTTTR